MTRSAVIIGANGGIGAALAEALVEEGAFGRVHRFARSAPGDAHLDYADEATIAAAAAVVGQGPPPTLIIVATGLLHDGDRGPEKSIVALDPAWMQASYLANAVGPALVAKHFLPLLPKGERAVFAALSARVGSITDNRLGGWHSYRAAKAALNMLIRGIAIETRRTHDRAIVVGLHPGTVDTPLSKPFQANVQPGHLFAPDRAAVQLLDVIDGLGVKDSGKLIAWDGTTIDP